MPADNPNELRDHLANERTFLAWIRTAITIVALGFVVAKFGLLLRQLAGAHVHSETARTGAIVGVALVATGVLAVILASQRFLTTRRNIQQGLIHFSPALDIALATIVSLASIVLAVYLVVTA
jgi:putative membrane protein